MLLPTRPIDGGPARVLPAPPHLFRGRGLGIPAVAHAQAVAVWVQRVRRLTGRVAGVAGQPVPVQHAPLLAAEPCWQLVLEHIYRRVPEVVVLRVYVVAERAVRVGGDQGAALRVRQLPRGQRPVWAAPVRALQDGAALLEVLGRRVAGAQVELHAAPVVGGDQQVHGEGGPRAVGGCKGKRWSGHE